MSEKVIQEIKLVETDDGFRLEVKGDKEQLRKMGFGPGMIDFFGPRLWRKRGKRHGRHRHGHQKHGRFHRHPHRRHRGFGPWGWHHEDTGAEESITKSESGVA